MQTLAERGAVIFENTEEVERIRSGLKEALEEIDDMTENGGISQGTASHAKLMIEELIIKLERVL